MKLTAKILLREYITALKQRGAREYGDVNGLKEQFEIERILPWRTLNYSLDYFSEKYIRPIANSTMLQITNRSITPISWAMIEQGCSDCACEDYNGISSRLILTDSSPLNGKNEMVMIFALMLEG